MNHLKCTLMALVSTIALSGCPNIFDPLDNPSGDAQLLSAARACFDRQEYECAREYYGQLSGDTPNAEQAFMILDEEGLGTDALVSAVAGGSGSSVGEILNRFVETASKEGASLAKRQRLALAYRKIASISNTELQGFVQFVVGMAISANIMAEQTGIAADHIFNKTDFVANASCTASAGSCAGGGAAACAGAGGSLATGASTDGDDLVNSGSFATADLSGTASLWMFFNAFSAASNGLSKMAVSEGSSFSLIDEIVNSGVTPSSNTACFRAGLNDLGVGR